VKLSSCPKITLTMINVAVLLFAATATAEVSYTFTDLGGGKAFGINDLGQVAGSSEGKACLWEGGAKTCLIPDSKWSEARGINNQGQIVGWSGNPGRAKVPFLFENGILYDLNDLIAGNPGMELMSAEGINNLGQIVGYGYLHGKAHAFLLEPIPEPEMMLPIMVGMVIFRLKSLRFRRRIRT